MRILHVGSGFRPLRRGGLVAYIEDLMDAQVARGHEVAYFFSGREYPLLRRPRVRRWRRSRVAMVEVLNSPLYDHGRQPELELGEPHVDALFARALEKLRPEIVHVHELAGLPFSLLDIVHAKGLPAVFTLQDYFPLCPTFKLLDARGQVCLRRDIGADCVATVAADPRPAGIIFDASARYHLERLPLIGMIPAARRERLVWRIATRVARTEAERRRRPAAPAHAYQRRRDANVERLNRVDVVIAMSRRVAEIYAQLGVDATRLRTVQLTLANIERLRPRRRAAERPLTFATLAGFESAAKGAEVLLDAMERLADQARAGSFRLLVFGHVDGAFAERARGLVGIEVRGSYSAGEQDEMLDGVDVGLLPSVWEEAYGYAGVEFLAKGIPVIGNAIGGIPDYVREGETGWLNRSLSGQELAQIMAGIIERPEQVADLNEKLIASRDTIVKTMAAHVDEMDAVYSEALAARQRAKTVVY